MSKLYKFIFNNSPSNLCERLISYLSTDTKFFEDPASYKYHHTYKSGLAIHSYELYSCLKDLVKENKMTYSDETLFLIAIGHDLDKIGTYNYDSVTKQFSFKPTFKGKMFHGEHSYFRLKKYLTNVGYDIEKLDDNELIRICILGHMGDCDRRKVAKAFYHDNVDKYPLLWLTHMADKHSCDLNGQDYLYLLDDKEYKLTDEEYHNIVDPINELGSMN